MLVVNEARSIGHHRGQKVQAPVPAANNADDPGEEPVTSRPQEQQRNDAPGYRQRRRPSRLPLSVTKGGHHRRRDNEGTTATRKPRGQAGTKKHRRDEKSSRDPSSQYIGDGSRIPPPPPKRDCPTEQAVPISVRQLKHE